MELAVYDKIEDAIIGSAFLKDLISIIFNNKIIVIPIINYFGNRIGELKLRLAFHHFDSKDCVLSKSSFFPTEDLKINLTEIHSSRRAESREKDKLNEIHRTISSNIQKQLQSLDISDSECCARNLHYNTPVSCHRQNANESKTSPSPDVKVLYSDNLKRSYSNISSQTFSPLQILSKETIEVPCNEKYKSIYTDMKTQTSNPSQLPSKEIFSTCYSDKFKSTYSDLKTQSFSPPKLPSKETYDDSSKVLYFNVKQNKKLAQAKKIVSRPKSAQPEVLRKEKINELHSKLGSEKIQATKPLVIEFKSPQKLKKNLERKINPKIKKKAQELKSIKKVSEEISKINKMVLPSSNSASPGQLDLEKIPVKDVSRKLPNSKVLNYLLGKNMSKRDELMALNEFKSISPCQNMVSSITDLCSNNVKIKCNKNGKIKVNEKLQFNLNDPVEKLYYKTFFSNKEEFEVVELLNRPENKFLLDRRKNHKEITKDVKKTSPKMLSPRALSSKSNSPSKKSRDTPPCKNFDVKDNKPKNAGMTCCGKENHFDCEFVRNCHKEIHEVVSPKNCHKEMHQVLSPKNCHKEVDEVPCLKNCHKETDEVPRPKNCLRCKYYKKLGELDKIIDSLKVFEKRMVTIEKESKLPFSHDVNLKPIRENCLLDDSQTSTITDLDLNGIDDDLQSISSEVDIERKNLLDDYDDLGESLDDSDFIEFSDYLARNKIYNMG